MRAQFGTFDGKDNRKTVMDCFKRMGKKLPTAQADMVRAAFLQAILDTSDNGFQGKKMIVDPCTAAEAYHLFVAITGVLGVPIEQAAIVLEEVASQ